MPKTPTHAAARQDRRHNPLAEEYAPTGPIKTKTPKRRKTAHDAKDQNYIDDRASRRILDLGQELQDEEAAETEARRPNPAFDFAARIAQQEEEAAEATFDDDDEAWGSDEEVEEIEVAPEDRAVFERFNPSGEADPSTLFTGGDADADDGGGGNNLADLIMAKIAQHEAREAGPDTGALTDLDAFPDRAPSPGADEDELPEKVVEVYSKVGQLLSRHRSGPLPKPFKILPSLPASQIAVLVSLTRPEQWTPHAHFLATRLFISAKPAVAQPFLHAILLPAVRDEIQETKKLNVHLYNALKKALYKPACFFKGILFPLLEDGTCTLREADIVSSVVARVSVPVLHSAAALLRCCDIAAEQFTINKEDGGGGATNTFIRVLLAKKYALPYKVIDALVFHFLRFRALANAPHAEAMDVDGKADRVKLPVLWHQALLTFAQRYRNDITEDQREALLDLVQVVGHRQMGPEVRRELLEGRGRGVPVEGAGQGDVEGGDDTMVMG